MKWNVVCRIYGGGSNVRRQYRERRKKTIRFLFLIQPGFDTTASLALERNRMEQQSSLLNVVVLYGLYYIVIDFNHDRFRGRERRETTNIRIIFFNHVPCVKTNKQSNTTIIISPLPWPLLASLSLNQIIAKMPFFSKHVLIPFPILNLSSYIRL